MTSYPARKIRALSYPIIAACAVLIAALSCQCALGASQAPPSESTAQDLDRWVSEGKDALHESGNRPWYDQPNDNVRAPKFQPSGKTADKSSSKSKNRPSSQPRQESSFSEPTAAIPMLQWLAWALIGVCIAVLVWLLIRAYLERETSQAAPSTPPSAAPIAADRVEALPFAMQRSEDDLLGAARKHFEAGNYSEAIIYLFSHQLVELDRAQCIRLAKGKTNRQYLKELAGRADLRGLLADTVDRFEMVFFGAQPLDKAAFETCWRRLPQFQQLLAGNRS